MPGIRGQCLGQCVRRLENAAKRRVAGRFVPGHTGGFKSAIHSKTNTRQKRARLKRNATIAGRGLL